MSGPWMSNSQIDSVTGLQVAQKSIGGAALVTNTDADGTLAPLGVLGTLKTGNFTPSTNFSAVAADYWTDTTGAKEFRVDPTIALGAGVALLVAFTTTAGDSANLESMINAAQTAFTTPNGVAQPGVIIVTDQNKDFIKWPRWDGTNRIKSIGVQVTAAWTGAKAQFSVVI
jgi:hypothetical protein